MKREFLKGLGLTDEQIDQIMAEHGKSVTKAKGDFDTLSAENQTMKTQLEASEKALKDFEKTNKDNEGLKESLAALKTENERIKTEAAEQLKNERIGNAIKLAVSESGARHGDLLIGKFDLAKLSVTDAGEVSGIAEQLDEMKKTYGDLFTPIVSGRTPEGSSGNVSPSSYEQLLANADNMTTEQIAEYFGRKE